MGKRGKAPISLGLRKGYTMQLDKTIVTQMPSPCWSDRSKRQTGRQTNARGANRCWSMMCCTTRAASVSTIQLARRWPTPVVHSPKILTKHHSGRDGFTTNFLVNKLSHSKMPISAESIHDWLLGYSMSPNFSTKLNSPHGNTPLVPCPLGKGSTINKPSELLTYEHRSSRSSCG